MTRFTIMRYGVPIGTAEIDPASDVATVAITPAPGYEAIRALARETGEALEASGFFGAAFATAAAAHVPSERRSAALDAGARFGSTLELRDVTGKLVPTTFIELAEWPGRQPETVAWVGFRASVASVFARMPAPGQSGGSGATPSD